MNTTEETAPPAAEIFTTANIIYITIAGVGLVDNLVVIAVIGASRTLRSRQTNVLILNQSFVDFIASVMILSATAIGKNPDGLSGFWGEVYCRVWIARLLQWSAIMTSTYNLVGITIERYVAVVHPLRYHTSFTSTKARWLCVAAWLFGCTFNVAMTLPTSRLVDGHCYDYAFYASEGWRRVNGASIFVFQYLLPVIVFAVCYTRMIFSLRRSLQNRPKPRRGERGGAATSVDTPMSRAKRNTLKTMVSVVIAFLLCHTANQCVFLAFSFGYDLDFNSLGYHATVIAAFTNCCISPFIYTLQYEQFQNELKHLLCGRPAEPGAFSDSLVASRSLSVLS